MKTVRFLYHLPYYIFLYTVLVPVLGALFLLFGFVEYLDDKWYYSRAPKPL